MIRDRCAAEGLGDGGLQRIRVIPHFAAPVVTIIVAVLVFSGAAALGVNASTGTRESEAFIHSGPWGVWRLIAACASVLFAGLFVAAFRALAAPAKWGLEVSASRLWTYLTLAVAGTGALAAGRVIVGGGTPDLPVANLELRISAVLLTALPAGIPTVVLVWLAHDACDSVAAQIETLSPLSLEPVVPSAGVELASAAGADAEPLKHREVICRMLRLWELVGFCIGIFALAVVAAIVTASSLRAAFLAARPDRGGEFPAVDVVYYGVLFAAIASVLNLPLVAAWRRSARAMVDQTFPLPPDGQPTEDWIAARARLEALLHLDVSFLRNPLTALTVLSPLLTAALAAVVPEFNS